MNFAEIKKAIIEYATSVEGASRKVKTAYGQIANVQNDMATLESKWDGLEVSINAISDAAVKASYLGQLALLREQRVGLVDMLTALDTAVTEAGLMLI